MQYNSTNHNHLLICIAEQQAWFPSQLFVQWLTSLSPISHATSPIATVICPTSVHEQPFEVLFQEVTCVCLSVMTFLLHFGSQIIQSELLGWVFETRSPFFVSHIGLGGTQLSFCPSVRRIWDYRYVPPSQKLYYIDKRLFILYITCCLRRDIYVCLSLLFLSMLLKGVGSLQRTEKKRMKTWALLHP